VKKTKTTGRKDFPARWERFPPYEPLYPDFDTSLSWNPHQIYIL